MKPARGLLTPKKIAPGMGMSMAATLIPASFIFCMIVAPKLASVWNSITKSTSRLMKLSAFARAVAPSSRLSVTKSSTPAASALATMPSSTSTQNGMSRCRLAKPMTYFSPFFGGVAAIASATIACKFSAGSIAPSKVAGS